MADVGETSPLPVVTARWRPAQCPPCAGSLLTCLAILSVATAVIHFAVAGSHFQEYWLFGVFMLAAGWLQLLWAVGAVVRPSSARLLAGGALLNAAIIAVYVVTRTVGDVVGPTPHATEPFGFGDGAVHGTRGGRRRGLPLAAGRQGRPARAARRAGRGDRRDRRRDRRPAERGPGRRRPGDGDERERQCPGRDVRSRAAAPACGMSAPGTSAVSLATKSPAGKITMPAPGMQMAPGMKMASSAPCDATPTRSQQRAAVRLVNASWKDAQQVPEPRGRQGGRLPADHPRRPARGPLPERRLLPGHHHRRTGARPSRAAVAGVRQHAPGARCWWRPCTSPGRAGRPRSPAAA